MLFRQPWVQFGLRATRPLKDYPRNTLLQRKRQLFRAAVAGVTHPYSRGVLCILSSLRFWGRREKFISATKIADRQQRRLHYKSHSFSLDKLQQFKDQWKQTCLITWPSVTVGWTPFNQLVISAAHLWVSGQVVGIFIVWLTKNHSMSWPKIQSACHVFYRASSLVTSIVEDRLQ